MILLEHNTFYLRDGVPFVRARMDGGSYTEKDDTILPLGTAVSSVDRCICSKQDNGTYRVR